MIDQDKHWMRLALKLAEQARGQTSPNPLVGAVVVKQGQAVGTGFHETAGGPHAEVLALNEAGANACGADLYVTLEPCTHYGRTPPCTKAIIAAGIRRVVSATIDPDPRVRGKGVEQLRQAGVEVSTGICEAEAQRQNAIFITYMTKQRPHVIWKSAHTLDGHPATRTGASRWITGEKARNYAHNIRAEVDAIMVGAGTLRADNPELTARPKGKDPTSIRQPIRIIADTKLRIALDSRCLDPLLPGRVIIATSDLAPPRKVKELIARGIDVWQAPPVAGQVDIANFLADLAKLKVTSVLLEGGPTLAGSFFDLGLIDQCHIYMAPLLFGGATAPVALAGIGAENPSAGARIVQIRRRQLGPDLLIDGLVESMAVGGVPPCSPD